jgi:hypothetical protein
VLFAVPGRLALPGAGESSGDDGVQHELSVREAPRLADSRETKGAR